MKQKGIIVVLLLMMMAAFASCGKKTQIGICFRDADDGVTTQLMYALTDSLKMRGYQVTAVDGVNDQARQNAQILRFLEQKYDLLIVEPVMTAEAEGTARAAKEADIPVIFLNYEPPEKVLSHWDQLCYIGCDLSQPGMVQNEMVQNLPDGGDVNADGTVGYLIISGPEDHMDANLWTDSCGCIPNAHCLGVEHGDWSGESGEKITGRCLGKYAEELEVIFCLDDEMALGALEAIRAAGRIPGENIYLTGVGGQWQALTLVADGEMTGTVCPDIFSLTQTVTDTADSMLSSKTVEKRTLLDYVAVTPENVQNFQQ